MSGDMEVTILFSDSSQIVSVYQLVIPKYELFSVKILVMMLKLIVCGLIQ